MMRTIIIIPLIAIGVLTSCGTSKVISQKKTDYEKVDKAFNNFQKNNPEIHE